MNGVSFVRGSRYGISSLDSAILSDLVMSATVSPNPEITDVFVRGTGWSSSFLSYLENQDLGNSQYGYRITGLTSSSPPIPWINVNEISLKFGSHRDVDIADLQISGYALSGDGFSYDSDEFTATWTLDATNSTFDSGRVTVALDSDGSTSNVAEIRFIGGDVGQDGATTVTDLVSASARMGTSASQSGDSYQPMADVNGDGVVTITDLVNVGSRALMLGPPSSISEFEALADPQWVPLALAGSNAEGDSATVLVPEPSALLHGLILFLMLFFGRNSNCPHRHPHPRRTPRFVAWARWQA
jgi:hypothetical protein